MSKPESLTYLSLHMFSLIERLSKFEYSFDIETLGNHEDLTCQPFEDGPGMNLRVPRWRGGTRTIGWSGFDVETPSPPPWLF